MFRLLHPYVIAMGFLLLVAFAGPSALGHSAGGHDNDVLLSRISDGSLYGYIDTNGNEIIPCRYRMAYDFSEGLAAVREHGFYGFIDGSGAYVIPPKYDFAEAFHEGVAIVYLDGNPQYIDKVGRQLFEGRYTSLFPFSQGRAKGQIGDKYGIVDKSGRQIVKPQYGYISDYHGGLAILKGYTDHFEDVPYSIVDTNGNVVVPEGIYEEISDYRNGYYLAMKSRNSDVVARCILDSNGRLVFEANINSDTFYNDVPHDGLLRVRMKHPNVIRKHADGGSFLGQRHYYAFVDMQGRRIIDDTDCVEATNFFAGRTMVRYMRGGWFMKDRFGKKIGNGCFSEIGNCLPWRGGACDNDGMKSGLVFVKSCDSTMLWGVIDTSEQYVVTPRFESVMWRNTGIERVFFYANKDTQGNLKWGIADIDGHILLRDTMSEIDRKGFARGLLLCSIGGKITYVNKRGQIVWQQDKTEDKLKALNVDYMTGGDFFASSAPHPQDLGGYGQLYNMPHVCTDTGMLNEGGEVGVKVDTTQRIPWLNNTVGLRVVVFNVSGRKVYFNATDNRLEMKVQAKDRKGEWRDIQYLPSSGCGNSYHILTLPEGKCWEFLAPVYTGAFKTSMRIALNYRGAFEGGEMGEKLTAYSNEYEGSINPAQVWRKEGYAVKGLLDSYMYR